jgi:uncharacterized protein (DUF1800 family)
MRAVRRGVTVGVAAVMVLALAGPFTAFNGPGAVPARPDDRTIVHVLNRIGFGPTPDAVARVREIGLQKYIDVQLDPARIDDRALAGRLASFETLSKSTSEMARQYFLPAQMARRQQQQAQSNAPQSEPSEPSIAGSAAASSEPAREMQRERMTPEQAEAVRMERLALAELMQAKILRAAYSERQLEEVLVDFWFNHFNVFSGKGQVRVYLNEYERDAIRPHVLGKFKDLLQATAESPAMLFYLDNWQSAAPAGAATSAQQAPRLTSRTARRSTPRAPQPNANQQRRRGGLNENYARELMELHTLGVDGGYTQKDVQEIARAFSGWTIANPRQGGGFRFEPRMHDDGEKVVLGHKLEPGRGKRDGDDVIALLAKHPSTARFVSTKLARRFVADEPPAALVARAAQRFKETDGDIREVVRTIVTSPEFFAAEAYRAKVKTPFEFVVSAVRATGVQAENALPLVQAVRTLGMPLYGCQPPTGYSDKAEAWVNSGALLGRMNFAVTLTSGRPRQAGGMTPAVTSTTLVAAAMAGDISASTAATIARATSPPQALALALGSPEFQKR